MTADAETMKGGLARTGIMEDFSPIHRTYFKLDEPVGVGQCTQGSSPGRAAAGAGLGEGRAGGTRGRGRLEGGQEGLMGGVRPGVGRSGRGTPSPPLLKPALTTEPSLCQEHLSTCPQGTPPPDRRPHESRGGVSSLASTVSPAARTVSLRTQADSRKHRVHRWK